MTKLTCIFTRQNDGYVSQCGYRVAFNKHWRYCPHCGRLIVNLSNVDLEDKHKDEKVYELPGSRKSR